MTTTDRRNATDAQFADELARLNRLDVADESAVERVARAICAAGNSINPSADPDLIWGTLETHGLADHYRRLARAAIDALKPAPGTDTSGHATCGHLSPALVGEQQMCDLSIGHGGAHQRDNGDGLPPMRWIESDSTEDALHRVLDLADQWESHAARADDAEPATRDDLSRMISASRWSRQHAAEVRAAIAGPQRDHDEEGS